MSRQIYSDSADAVASKLAQAESEWPEYKNNTSLTAVPSYAVKTDHDLTGTTFSQDSEPSWQAYASEGAAWLKKYLHQDVEELQKLNEIYHPPFPSPTGYRIR